MTTPLAPRATDICPTTTRKRLAEGALLVDVREDDELVEASFDVPHVVHVPLSTFDTRYAELPRDRALVIACRSGGRSLRATQFLLNHGYEQVANMSGGLLKWQAKGFPMHGHLADASGDISCDC